MLSILWKSMVAPLEVFRREGTKAQLNASIAVMLTAAGLGSIALPVIGWLADNSQCKESIRIGGMAIALIISIVTFLSVCGMFWLFSKAFHKLLCFREIVSVWGLSYLPNAVCIILYGVLKLVPSLYLSSAFASFAFGAMFILCLVWKAIDFFILIRFVFLATLSEFARMTAASVIVFTLLMLLGAKVGIQVPML